MQVFDLSKVIAEPGAGIVDYVVLGRGQKPPGGIFVLGYLDDPAQVPYNS